MCSALPVGMARRLYSVCQFLMCWVGRVKKDSEAVHGLCEKQCHALHGVHLPSVPAPGCQVHLLSVSGLGRGQFGHREEAVTSVWSRKGQSILAVEGTMAPQGMRTAYTRPHLRAGQ